MSRHDHRAKLQVDTLEDRNAASDALQFLLGGVGLASVLDAQALEATPPLSRRLNLEAPPLSSGVSSVSVLGGSTSPAFTPTDSPARASSADIPDEPPMPAASFPDALDSTFALTALAASSATTARGQSALVSDTPQPGGPTKPVEVQHAPMPVNLATEVPKTSGPDTRALSAPSPVEEASTAGTERNDKAVIHASTDGAAVTVEALGPHKLTNVRALAGPAAGAAQVAMPLGLFGFDIRGVTPGGTAAVRMVLPEGSAPTGYFKQDATGALYSFDFDGTTGAVIDGNVVTLHFVDGGRGDLDGKANGVIVDPGGPGGPPGYAWTEIILAAKVREVTFSGDDLITIEADPGTPDYPAPPHWVDTDVNGQIDAPGDHALPVGYPHNTDSVVSARFKPTWGWWPYPPAMYSLMVRGSNTLSATQPYYYLVPETVVTLEEGDLVLGPTTVSNPFPTYVNYSLLTINWEFSNNGGLSWSGAGQSQNELYITLDTPSTAPVYHTLIHTSVPISAVVPAEVEQQVISQTWLMYEPRTLKTRHLEAAWNGREVRYYNEWDTPNQDYTSLLANYDGQCYSFAELFIHSLKAAGVNTTQLIPFTIEAISDEHLLVNRWAFIGDGSVNVQLNNEVYRYQNTLVDPTVNPFTNQGLDLYWREMDGVWEYFWGGIAEVQDMTGLQGQNSGNPKSTFTNHTAVLINNQLYDPSYGTGPFDSLQEWEDASVPSFWTVEQQGNNYRMLFRKNLPGPSVIGIQ